MTEFLLLTLYAPLASWGDIAVGEMRGSWDRPSRSAILGLVAAALGLEREAQDAHDALSEGYGVAVRLDAPGTPLSDYHTAQTVDATAVRKRRPATRAELLAAPDRQTILSRRAYRQDAVATAALWARATARWPLAALADALRRPAFALYAGRKANVLGLPLDPRVVPADTLADAFAHYAARRTNALAALPDVCRALRPSEGWGREVAHDPLGAADAFETGLERDGARRVVRRDAAPHRTRWQFAERVVDVGLLPAAGGGA